MCEEKQTVKKSTVLACGICYSAPHGIPCPDSCDKCSFARSFGKDIDDLCEEAKKDLAKEILDKVSLHVGGGWLAKLYSDYVGPEDT